MQSCSKLWTIRHKEIKNPTATSEELGAKEKCWEQRQGTVHAPARTTTEGVGKPPEPHLWPDSWTDLYPHSTGGTSSLFPWGSCKQGNL